MTIFQDCGDSRGVEGLSETLTAVSRIDGVDIGLALSRISGRQGVLEASIEQTAFLIDEKIQRMDTCLISDDLSGFAIEAHGLKGVLAVIGATGYSELASELETLSKAGDRRFCEERFKTFFDTMSGLAAELKGVFTVGGSAEKPEGGKELLFQVLKEAAADLSLFEADDARKRLGVLDEYTFGEEMDALLGHIKDTIVFFRYDEATMLLKGIIEAGESR